MAAVEPFDALDGSVIEGDVDRADVVLVHTLADQCPGECYAADGIHLTQAGAEYFAERLGDITGY